MPAKKKTDVATVPVEGEVLPNMDIGVALGRITTVALRASDELAAGYNALARKPDLPLYAGTIEGNAEVKAFLKLCSSTRSQLDAAHKDAKAPYLAATRELDAGLKAAKDTVLQMENPIKKALADYEQKQQKLAAEAQAARLAELEAENAKLRQHLETADVIPPFEDRRVSVIVRGRDASQAARALFGDAYDEVKTDERGVNYVLEVVLQRKEIQDV